MQPVTADRTILVFSDPHGRIPLLLWLVWQWQRDHDCPVDLVLVAGDLGVWPDSRRLGSSTRKYSRTDSAELGFQVFESRGIIPHSQPSKVIAAHLSHAREAVARMLPDITARVVFVGGNHEDYEYLGECAALDNAKDVPLVPVETSRRICWLPPGRVHEQHGLLITGISGIDPAACGRDPARYHPTGVLTDESIIDSTLDALEASGGREVDVLLTHDGLPDAVRPGKGTLKLLDVIATLNPLYHFFGHYHSSIAPLHYAQWLPELGRWYPRALDLCPEPGRLRTQGVHINKLAIDPATRAVRQQAMAVLNFEAGTEPRFAFVDPTWLGRLQCPNQLS